MHGGDFGVNAQWPRPGPGRAMPICLQPSAALALIDRLYRPIQPLLVVAGRFAAAVSSPHATKARDFGAPVHMSGLAFAFVLDGGGLRPARLSAPIRQRP